MADKWDLRFLELAKLISTWSKDPSTKCGAVIVNTDKQIIATGYNGFPAAIEDSEELLNNREEKYKRVIHAELNALLQVRDRKELAYSALYIWPDCCCARCAVHVIQSGVQYINFPIFNGKHLMQERWEEDIKLATSLFDEAGIFYEGIEWETN